MAIIFHSGSFDRLYHGLSFALAGLALGREVRLFFSYWALEYLKNNKPTNFKLTNEGKEQDKLLTDKIEKGHIQSISELLTQVKSMGGKTYACTASMGLLNIARDELVKEVDKSMGITTFLTETVDSQLLFI